MLKHFPIAAILVSIADPILAQRLSIGDVTKLTNAAKTSLSTQMASQSFRDGAKTDLRSLAVRSSNSLASVAGSQLGQNAIMLATTLTTMAISFLPGGLILSGLFAATCALFGSLFGEKPPTPDDIFADVQGKITQLVTAAVNDMLDGQQDLANANAVQMIQEKMKLYQQAIADYDIKGKVDALESLVTAFESLRSSPDVFVSAEFFEEKAAYYLFRAEGTNLCYGPRRAKNGDPLFSPKYKDDPNYHLWDCHDIEINSMLRLKNDGKNWYFASDQNTNGQYCPLHKKADKWDGGLLYKFQSPCDSERVSWSHVQALENKDQTKLIIASDTPNGDEGIAFLACGNGTGHCPGMNNDGRCYWAQNKNDNLEISQRLFRKSFDQCFSIFEKIPHYANLPPSRVKKLLFIIPLLTRINLLALVELNAIEARRGVCNQFDTARDAWSRSFRALSHYYRMLPEPKDDLIWLEKMTKQMHAMLDKANCEKATKAVRFAALKLAEEKQRKGEDDSQASRSWTRRRSRRRIEPVEEHLTTRKRRENYEEWEEPETKRHRRTSLDL